eukprot:g1481.t1
MDQKSDASNIISAGHSANIESMYLKTIKNKSKFNIAPRSTTDVSDIPGAQPGKLPVREKGDQLTFHGTTDISGASPKKIHAALNYKKKEIEGTRSKRGFGNGRHVDPLVPQYKLASCEPLVPVEQKYIRNSLDVSDIEGTRPRENKAHRSKKGESENFGLRVDDIDGASAGWKPVNKRPTSNGKNYAKYAPEESSFTASKRITNPLDPTYHLHNRDIELEKHRNTFRKSKERVNSTLNTTDIKGAQADSIKTLHVKERSQYRTINQTADIKGAQANTLNRGLRTNRQTNPMTREYTWDTTS